MSYSTELRKTVLRQMQPPNHRSIPELSKEEVIAEAAKRKPVAYTFFRTYLRRWPQVDKI